MLSYLVYLIWYFSLHAKVSVQKQSPPPFPDTRPRGGGYIENCVFQMVSLPPPNSLQVIFYVCHSAWINQLGTLCLLIIMVKLNITEWSLNAIRHLNFSPHWRGRDNCEFKEWRGFFSFYWRGCASFIKLTGLSYQWKDPGESWPRDWRLVPIYCNTNALNRKERAPNLFNFLTLPWRPGN